MSRPSVIHRLFFAVRPSLVLARQIAQSGLWDGPEDRALRADQLHMTIDILDDFPSFPERVADMLCDAAETVSADPVPIVAADAPHPVRPGEAAAQRRRHGRP
jgi:2'-5' RNA ligase